MGGRLVLRVHCVLQCKVVQGYSASVVVIPPHDTANKSEANSIKIEVVVRLLDAISRGLCRNPIFSRNLAKWMVEGREGKRCSGDLVFKPIYRQESASQKR